MTRNNILNISCFWFILNCANKFWSVSQWWMTMKNWRRRCWASHPLSYKCRAVSTLLLHCPNVRIDDDLWSILYLLSPHLHLCLCVTSCCASSSSSCCHTRSVTRSKDRFLNKRFQDWSMMNCPPKLNLDLNCSIVYVLAMFRSCSSNNMVVCWHYTNSPKGLWIPATMNWFQPQWG